MALKSKSRGRKAIESNFYWCGFPVYSHCMHDTLCFSPDSHTYIDIYCMYNIYAYIIRIYRVFLDALASLGSMLESESVSH